MGWNCCFSLATDSDNCYNDEWVVDLFDVPFEDKNMNWDTHSFAEDNQSRGIEARSICVKRRRDVWQK